jgi:hypothetical protein
MGSFTAIAGWVADLPAEVLARLYARPANGGPLARPVQALPHEESQPAGQAGDRREQHHHGDHRPSSAHPTTMAGGSALRRNVG